MERNWDHFFWLTGETPRTLSTLVTKLWSKYLHHFYTTKGSKLDLKNQVSCNQWYMMNVLHYMYWTVLIVNCMYLLQVLLTMIWLWNYPTMQSLAILFGIHVASVHKIIHKYLRILHSYLVPKYIRWHSMGHWRRLAGTYPEWPTVVALLDCTPFRISKPTSA